MLITGLVVAQQATDLVNAQVEHAGQIIGAIAALGTAAYGLVDVTKVFNGGISNAGFGHITGALQPFDAALVAAGGEDWQGTLRAHWINGMDKADQKAVAKALIRLGLSSDNAAQIALAGRVDPDALRAVITAIETGGTLTEQQMNVIGRMDAMIDAALDRGFERADQAYRNASKAAAALIAVVLAVAGEWMILSSANQPMNGTALGMALLVGFVSVPLAPIAKDISTSLVTAVKAMKSVRGGS